MGSQGRTVGPQGQSRRLLPTPSGHPGLGGGVQRRGASRHDISPGVVQCAKPTGWRGPGHAFPGAEQNAARAGRTQLPLPTAFLPAPRSQLPGECAPQPRVPGSPCAPSPARPPRGACPMSPARPPPPWGAAARWEESGAARLPSRAVGVGRAAALSPSGASLSGRLWVPPGSGRPGTNGSCVRLTRGGPAPPSPAGLAAEQSAILRATDAHCMAGDEGIRVTPSLTLLLQGEENVPAGGVGKHLASWPSPERRCQFSLPLENQMEAATFHLPPPPSLGARWGGLCPPPPAVSVSWPQPLKAGEQERSGGVGRI